LERGSFTGASIVNDLRYGKGQGFRNAAGEIFLERCFKCGKENWAVAVATGICAFCGYDANKEVPENV